MNIFKSDKAPYILGLFVTVLGWQVTQIGEEATRTHAVTYRLDIDRQTGDVVADIRNVSRTKSLRNATFSLACSGGHDCLQPIRAQRGAVPVFGEVRAVAPNAIDAADEVVNQSSSIAWRNTVAAGGRYQLIAKLSEPNSNLDFFFIPDGSTPLDIVIYDSRSITGFLIENYFKALIFSFFVCIFMLILSVAINARREDTEKGKEETDDDARAPGIGPSDADDNGAGATAAPH